jgi:F-type H+-transporting ATPase subunit a
MSIYGPLEHSVPVVFQAAILGAAILLSAAMLARKRMIEGGVLPDEGITLRNIFEALTEYLLGMAEAIIGERARDYLALVCAIFFFILISNLMGLIPGIGGATSFVETAFSWALISFGIYNYVGIRAHGWKYIYQFMGPSLWEPEIGGKVWHVRVLSPLFLPLELLLHVARVVTLTVRLVANMYADHTVVGVWITLWPYAVPAVFMALGTLVAFLQAFVFSLLTMIYIGSALEEAH